MRNIINEPRTRYSVDEQLSATSSASAAVVVNGQQQEQTVVLFTTIVERFTVHIIAYIDDFVVIFCRQYSSLC